MHPTLFSFSLDFIQKATLAERGKTVFRSQAPQYQVKYVLAWLLTFLLGIVSPALAQSPQPTLTTLTEKDKLNINAESLKAVRRLGDLLNSFTDEDLKGDNVTADSMVLNSYTGPNRYFDNVNVVIEDDIKPTLTSSDRTDDLTVDVYLNRLFLYYVKRSNQANQNTIIFSEPKPTAVQETGGSIFIKVFFKSDFKGEYKPNPKPYLAHQRVAEMRVEKGKGKFEWKLYITRLGFVQPGEGMQQLATGRPTIPSNLSISGPEVPFHQTDTKQIVTLKFDAKWVEVINSEETDVPTGFYQRKVKAPGQVYEYDNSRTIEFRDNSDRFILQKELTAKWFDRVNPIGKKTAKPDTVAKSAVPIAVVPPRRDKPLPDTTRKIASVTPKPKETPPVVTPPVPAKKDSTKLASQKPPVVPKPDKPAATTTAIATAPVKPSVAKTDSAQRSATSANPAVATKSGQEVTDPQSTIAMKARKQASDATVPDAKQDTVQRVAGDVSALKSSKPAALPSKLPSLVSVNRRDSVDIPTSEYIVKPPKKEPIVALPKSQTLGPELAKTLDAEAKKEKARYKTQGWLQIAAGVAGLAGSYMAYSAIKTDYDAYSAKMEKLNAEYTNWLAVTRQPAGAAVTPLSMASYGKPATYGIYAGAAISVGAVINGIRFLGKAGKVKSKPVKK